VFGPDADQTRLPVFRLLLLVQVAAAGFFGIVPLLLPQTFASLFGYTGRDELMYRLAGAASTGYAVAALVALVARPTWAELRIPVWATLTFNAGAAFAAALTVASGDRGILPVFILVAASVFAVFAAYWLFRDVGPAIPSGASFEIGFRIVLALATLIAAVFGLFPLLAPERFATLFNLSGQDQFIFRLAGAGTLGYAVAGIIELRSGDYRRIRLQNFAAVVFNVLGAMVAALAWLGGAGGLLAPVVAVAATFFAVTLTWFSFRVS
jgi:hypothetical protein